MDVLDAGDSILTALAYSSIPIDFSPFQRGRSNQFRYGVSELLYARVSVDSEAFHCRYHAAMNVPADYSIDRHDDGTFYIRRGDMVLSPHREFDYTTLQSLSDSDSYSDSSFDTATASLSDSESDGDVPPLLDLRSPGVSGATNMTTEHTESMILNFSRVRLFYLILYSLLNSVHSDFTDSFLSPLL